MSKRKREDRDAGTSSIAKVAPGTVVYSTGKAVKAGLASGSRQALVAFTQQIITPHSKLPLPLNSPAVVILQQYLDVSAVCDEVFDAWNEGDKRRDEKQVEAAVHLLAQIIRILTPLPFFRGSVVGLVNKLIAPQERYHDLLNRLVSSNSRDGMLAGLSLAAAAVNVEKPDPTSSTASASSGRLASKVWGVLLDGGSVRGLGKQLGMRRRRKDGSAIYDEADPMDKPDIRHLVLDITLPLVSTYAFHSHAKALLRPLYSNLEQDPPSTILRILTALWEAITRPSPGQGRKTALVLLDESALSHLVELFNRDQVEPSSGRTVAEMAQAFVEGVTSKPGRGVCFADEGWYPRKPKEGALTRLGADDDDDREMHLSIEDRMRRGLHNRILSNVVRKLGGKVVDDNGRVGEWAVKVFEACPELVAGYWPNSALAVDPRLSARWIATMAYIGSIVSLPCPDLSTFRQPLPKGSTLELAPFRSQPPAITTMIESILPSPLTKTHMTKGLSHPDHLVQLVTAQTLARCLQKLSRTRDLLRTIEAEVTREPGSSEENPWSVCIRQLEMEARRRVPELMVVIAFAQKSAIMGQVAEDEEVDEALASKSAMLTEAALRLFGLYHQAIPAVTRDTKFDVGRLLVSSSSVKQERRERKDAKANAGSVADETMSQGSIGSMGSAGTAGMGGGFGYAKGDVKGFEALSQVHVLQLLGSVKGWQWINKASGSQYTYLYHILQLHLASHHPSTILHTTALIRHLLLPTPLFDHDPSELDLWLSCLPRLPIGSGALGIIQQVHFLSFFDDCVRRCVKLPYRYLDEVTGTVPGYFNPQHLHTFPSILLMTMVEQWCAKVSGSHISSEAAGVVGHVVGRILLGLVGKMRDMTFVRAVLGRMQGTLEGMRKEGKAKEGSEQLLEGISSNLGKVDQTAQTVDGQEEPRLLADLLDEREWRATSFDYTASHLPSVDSSSYENLVTLITAAPPGSQARCARFTSQLLASRSDDDRRQFLALVKLSIETCSDTTEAPRAKEAVFDSGYIKRALTSTDEIDSLVSVLDENDTDDQAVAEQYVIALEQGILTDKKGKRLIGTLDLTTPWARFFNPTRASSVITKLGHHADRLHGTRKGKAVELTSRITSTISTLLAQCADPNVALADLGLWADIGVLGPVAAVVQRATLITTSAQAQATVKITSDTLEKLLMSSSSSTGRLIEALVLAYPSAALALANLLQKRSDVIAGRTELMPAIRAVLDLPGSIDLADSGSTIADIAQIVIGSVDAPGSEADTAVDVLEMLIQARAVSTVPITTFTTAHARLAERLADQGEQVIVQALLEEGLKAAISICATTVPLDDAQTALLSALVSAVKALSLEQVNLDGLLVESVIAAITQDRLTAEAPVLLAAALIQRCDIKASFVRQQLSLLSSVPYYNTLCAPSCTPSTRLPFIRIYSALFHSSTYTSCQPNFIEPLLPLYTGSLHIADRLILDMWQTFESVRHLSVSSILRNWSANGLSGLTGAGKALDALVSLDGGRVMATCINFPLRRTLAVQDQDRPQEPTPYGQTKQVKVKSDEPWGEQEEKGYDPVFVLNLLGGVLAASEVPPGKEQEGEEERYEEAESEEVQYQLSGLDWVEIIRSDTLAVAVCALASRDAEMRRLAGHVLGRVMAQIQDVTFHERDQLLYVLTLIQHAVPDPSTAPASLPEPPSAPAGAKGFVRSWDAPTPAAPSVPAPPRLPAMTTLFLAYHLHSLGSPSHFLYPITSRFLLQRPVLDLYDPPMLYALLYGSDRGPRGELPSMQEVRRGRGWIVRLIRDGTRSEVDWSICRRRNVWALLSSMFRISVDVNFRRLVLQTMESMALVPQAARTLVHKHCILPWAKLQYELSFKETNRASAEERERYVKLVELCVRGCVDGEVRKARAKAAASAQASGPDGGAAGSAQAGIAMAAVVGGVADDNADSESDSDGSDSESESDSDDQGLVDPLADADEDDQDPLLPRPPVEADDNAVGGSSANGVKAEGEDPVLALCEVLTPRPDWLVDVESFIDAVLGDAGISRLAALSRILLRVSILPQAKETIAYSLPRIVERLIATTSNTSVSHKSAHSEHSVRGDEIRLQGIEQEVVENLFRAGLAMGEGDSPVAKIGLGLDIERTRSALGELMQRVQRMDGEVGKWVRREVRVAEWEALAKRS